MVSSRLQVLRRTSDYALIKKNGKKYKPCTWILLNYIFNDEQVCVYGMTVSKKVGSAVLRNRLKRWCREYFRKKDHIKEFPFKVNIVFLPQPEGFYKKQGYKDFCLHMDSAVERIKKNSKTNRLGDA